MIVGLLATAWADPIAISAGKDPLVAATVPNGVRVFRLADGAEVATIAVPAPDVAWQDGRLFLLERGRVSTWDPPTVPGGLGHVELHDLRGTPERRVGPNGLVYSWTEHEASVLDPVTGLASPLWSADRDRPFLDANADGFLDAAGFHGWDGALRFPVDPPGRRDDCRIAAGPAVWCPGATAARLYRAGGEPRTLKGRHLAWRDGWAVTDAGKVARLVNPQGAEVAASAPGIQAAVLDGGFAALRTKLEQTGAPVTTELAVWALAGDGTASERLRVALAPLEQIEVPLPTSALLVEGEKEARILARDDGRELAVIGRRVSSWSVRDGRLVLSFRSDPPPTPAFRRFNDDTWVYEPDGRSTGWTLRRAGTGGRVCDGLVAFYAADGTLEAYGADRGARRFAVKVGAGARVVACTADRWLVSDDGRWRVLDTRRGAVLYEGAGSAAGTVFPGAVMLGDEKHRQLFGPSGELPVPEGFHPVRSLGDGVLLSSGPQRAVVDASGVRWRVNTTLALSVDAAADGRVYLAGSTLAVALDARTGALVWAAPTSDARATRLVVLDP